MEVFESLTMLVEDTLDFLILLPDIVLPVSLE
jgi:hypothetical protein